MCLGVLQRNRLYSIEAPGDCCQEGCSPSSRSGVAQSEEEEVSKGWPEAKGGGQGIVDPACRGCRVGDGLFEELTEDAEGPAEPLPSEVLKEEDPCQFDRWCSESGRIPGDKGIVEEEEGGADIGCGDEGGTIKGEFGASNNPLKPIPFPSWVEKFVGQVIAAKTRFSYFVKSSIRCCRSGRLSSTATALFPIPFADVAIWTGPRGLSKEKRTRLAELKVLHLVICGLNYQYFRQPFSVLGLLRRRPSQKHVEVFSRLLSHIRACGHSDMVSLVGCGRKSFQLSARFEELWHFLKAEGLDRGDAYSRGRGGHAVEKNDEAFEELRPYRDLDASRLKIVGKGQWDCSDFLPDLFYMVFKEPRINVFDLPFREDEVPDNTRNSHEEMLALCRLCSFPLSLGPPGLRCAPRCSTITKPPWLIAR